MVRKGYSRLIIGWMVKEVFASPASGLQKDFPALDIYIFPTFFPVSAGVRPSVDSGISFPSSRSDLDAILALTMLAVAARGADDEEDAAFAAPGLVGSHFFCGV